MRIGKNNRFIDLWVIEFSHRSPFCQGQCCNHAAKTNECKASHQQPLVPRIPLIWGIRQDLDLWCPLTCQVLCPFPSVSFVNCIHWTLLPLRPPATQKQLTLCMSESTDTKHGDLTCCPKALSPLTYLPVYYFKRSHCQFTVCGGTLVIADLTSVRLRTLRLWKKQENE